LYRESAFVRNRAPCVRRRRGGRAAVERAAVGRGVRASGCAQSAGMPERVCSRRFDAMQPLVNAVPLSIVVPVRNEEENVLPLIAEIDAALAGRVDYEIIYVDDGSADGTAAALARARERYPQLRVMTHSTSCGQSAALRTGVLAARGAWIATLDGDCQNDPADLPKLLAVRDDPAQPRSLQLVAGHRRTRQDSWMKRLSSRIANGVRAKLLGDGTPDTGCGLKLISRDAYLALPFFDHMHRFLPALVQRNGGTTVSVEVNHRPRVRGLWFTGTETTCPPWRAISAGRKRCM
jgi:dolichol-phosphate mannosyltransferase